MKCEVWDIAVLQMEVATDLDVLRLAKIGSAVEYTDYERVNVRPKLDIFVSRDRVLQTSELIAGLTNRIIEEELRENTKLLAYIHLPWWKKLIRKLKGRKS